jgi:glycosyltransferase involved in cell wall biosynthesis
MVMERGQSVNGEAADTGKLPVSVIVLTYNEERNIEACLQSVVAWAGKVFVVDSGSTDRTVALARQYGAQVVTHPFENYSRQRTWAQDQLPLSFPWVFHIDADERVTPELAQSFKEVLCGGGPADVDGIIVSRRTVFLGRAILHGGHYPAYHLRLFRRARGRCEDRLYDQHFLVDGATRVVAGDLIDVITSDLTVWLVRHARWGAEEAREQMEKQAPASGRLQGRATGTPIEKRRWWRTTVYDRAPLFLRAFAYFVYRYFLRLGFLDGKEGLIFHFLQGCCFRFYVDAKIYEARRQRQNLLERTGFQGHGQSSLPATDGAAGTALSTGSTNIAQPRLS